MQYRGTHVKWVAVMLVVSVGIGIVTWVMTSTGEIELSKAGTSLMSNEYAPSLPQSTKGPPDATAKTDQMSVATPSAVEVEPSPVQSSNTSAHDSRVLSLPENSLSSVEQGVTDQRTSRDVVGRPFQHSPTSTSYCENHPVVTATNCREISKLLTRFAGERGDEQWAPNIEAKIRTQVPRTLPDAEIQALECRTTICALEVTSQTHELRYLFPYQYGVEIVTDSLRLVESTTLIDPLTGTLVIRTVRVFERSE